MNPFSYAKRLLAETFGAEPEAPTQAPDPYAALASRAAPAPPFDPMDPIGSTAQFRIGQPEPTLQIPQQAAQAPQEPQAPQSPAKGFLQRMQETPGMGLGLMQLGAGIASGNNWGEGIGAGFSGMADTLQKQQALDYQRKQQELDMAARQESATATAQYRRDSLLLRAQGKSSGKSNIGDKQYTGKDINGADVRAFKREMPDGSFEWLDADNGSVIPGASGMKPLETSRAPTNREPRDPKAVEVFSKDGTSLGFGQQLWNKALNDFEVLVPGMPEGSPRTLTEMNAAGQRVVQSTGSERGKGIVDLSKAMALHKDARGAELAMHSLSTLRDDLENSPDGGVRYAQRLMGQAQTLLGQSMNVGEMREAIMSGDKRASSIVGLLRQEVVGGGTMTEQDAIRILDALGGDPASPVWNKAVALDAIDEIIRRNEVRFKDSSMYYNEAQASQNNPERYISAFDTTAGVDTKATLRGQKTPSEQPARRRRWNAETRTFEDL